MAHSNWQKNIGATASAYSRCEIENQQRRETICFLYSIYNCNLHSPTSSFARLNLSKTNRKLYNLILDLKCNCLFVFHFYFGRFEMKFNKINCRFKVKNSGAIRQLTDCAEQSVLRVRRFE